MWEKIGALILRYKFYFLTVILGFTAFMAFMAGKVELAYNMQKLVPKNDADFVDYEKFKSEFGDDGNKLIIGFKSEKIFNRALFNDLHSLGNRIQAINGVYDVLSVANLYNLVRNDSIQQFEIRPLAQLNLSQ